MPKLPHELADDELASMYGEAPENSLQRNKMEGESLRRQLLMRREELKWIRTAAITAIVSLVVLVYVQLLVLLSISFSEG
ncbi:hypothetical protein MKR81_28595 (plasmid) [Vibrio campbellii]|uniref:hypothetical protein n=1 Tax=Vibrio campbellii TaxID=680 RepID=UPI001F07B0E6|nr:hypothetical protein [Vibrio campbellii]UMM07009.1 hypothetical protein MKR81_28490 [Vibrio campbellii]UMM07094.1 hypothetical protein MKR81_28595 [Vibrio campbellii]